MPANAQAASGSLVGAALALSHMWERHTLPLLLLKRPLGLTHPPAQRQPGACPNPGKEAA